MNGVATTDRDIYEAVAPGLTRFATALVGAGDAADVVSTVVVRVLARRTLSSIEKPEAYLMQAVMNEARALHRGRKRRTSALVRIGPAPVSRDAAELATTELTSAVMSLPPQQRAAAYLVYWCDYSAAEAAELMGWSQGTARRYLHLVRQKLKGFADA